jgi:predicted GNAT family N-acyltransferase
MSADAPLAMAPVTEADRSALDAYLAARSDTCMMLRSNLHAVGLAWDPPSGARLQGQYVLGWRDGVVVGVAGHAWNGILLVQADAHAGELATEAVRRSGRRVNGLLGVFEQVVEARAALGLAATPAGVDNDEILMALVLDRLVIPAALRDGVVIGRRARASDREGLLPLRVAYYLETGQHAAVPAAEQHAAATIDSAIAGQHVWLVERDGAVVAMCTHNASLPDSVQIGGVFTPPSLRGRGHARAVVATSLLDARAAGAARAILFTPRPDAVAAYRAVGFEPIGRYAVVLFGASP